MRFPGWVSPVPRGGYTPPAPPPPLRWSIPHPPSPSRPRILIFPAFSYHYKMQRVANPLTYVAISTLYSCRVKSASISALRAPACAPARTCPRHARTCPRHARAMPPGGGCSLSRLEASTTEPTYTSSRLAVGAAGRRPRLHPLARCAWCSCAPIASRLADQIVSAKRPIGFIPPSELQPYNVATQRRQKKSAAYSSAGLKMYKIAVRAPGEKPRPLSGGLPLF